MAQIIDALPSEDDPALLCCYANVTSKIQIARITNVPNWYFERVVFPGQRLMFEAAPNAQLEIHTGMMASAILSDTIACEKLVVDSGDGLDNSLDALVRNGSEAKENAPQNAPQNSQAKQAAKQASVGAA